MRQASRISMRKCHRPRRETLRPPLAIKGRRPIIAAVVVALSALAAVLCAWVFGRGFAPAPPVEASNYGIIQAIRLPIGARSMDELTNFEVEMAGADDFARVYVNNYLAISTENPKAILLFAPDTDLQQKLMAQLSVKRNMPAPGRRDVIGYLRKGINTIVFENENSIFGACGASITLFANGKKLERFPVRVPNGLYPERVSLAPAVIELFERTRAVPSTDDVLCARRILCLIFINIRTRFGGTQIVRRKMPFPQGV
jgi:hypothetical protein